ncbi:MAG: adenylate/guanylate cyclase domain-containing protein [Verrucomicrobia bacterium]|nr:adenylate/guanylate cyclase domain-containing protein [Verrucomicrobiota bacterium]
MTAHAKQHFRWTWEFASPPEALWPLVSNTDRFNRDCGYPPVTIVPTPSAETATITNSRRLRATVMGLVIEWDELPFEWLAPYRFGVDRTYCSGPIAKMVMFCELHPRAGGDKCGSLGGDKCGSLGGGTTLVYDLRLTPAGLFGRLALPFSIGQQARATTERVFRRYDEFAQRGLRTSQLAQKPKLAAGGAARLAAIGRTLVTAAGQPAPLVEKLREFVASADELSAARIRPYALADEWRASRRDTLHLFLHATRAGLLDFSWDLLCPHCRGAKASQRSLDGVTAQAHCETCHIDFTANFDQSVELTFTPNASVRAVTRVDYCVGGPQITPHIVAQQSLRAGERRALPLALAPGRYCVRSPGAGVQHAFRVEPGAPAAVHIDLGAAPLAGQAVAPAGELTLVNAAASGHLAIVEHLAWSDQATTAAEVTSLQVFRDLFSREVLRAGEQISVGSMTVVFTDLKNSTQLYQDIGDAPAFGRVLTHFEILKAAVAAENGAIVKTMGDAIMAVFPRPVAALRAMQQAQRHLAHPLDFSLPAGVAVPPSSLQPLALKAGIHCGPCLAINQNERLDYFGSTVNITARLCSLCTGADLVLSSSAHADPEVAAHLAAPDTALTVAPEKTMLKGFGDTAFEVWRIARS